MQCLQVVLPPNNRPAIMLVGGRTTTWENYPRDDGNNSSNSGIRRRLPGRSCDGGCSSSENSENEDEGTASGRVLTLGSTNGSRPLLDELYSQVPVWVILDPLGSEVQLNFVHTGRANKRGTAAGDGGGVEDGFYDGSGQRDADGDAAGGDTGMELAAAANRRRRNMNLEYTTAPAVGAGADKRANVRPQGRFAAVGGGGADGSSSRRVSGFMIDNQYVEVTGTLCGSRGTFQFGNERAVLQGSLSLPAQQEACTLVSTSGAGSSSSSSDGGFGIMSTSSSTSRMGAPSTASGGEDDGGGVGINGTVSDWYHMVGGHEGDGIVASLLFRVAVMRRLQSRHCYCGALTLTRSHCSLLPVPP